jgi:hypothetical protein
MVESPEPTGIPPPPETPEWLKTIRWISHHFLREGEVIWKAPVATALAWGLLTYASYWYLSVHFSERLENLTSANTSLQATIGQLQNELKGASPQLAAIQARRVAVRGRLLELYVMAGPLIGKEIPTNYNDENSMKQSMSVLEQDASTWAAQTASFIEENLGPAARERFLDISNMPTYNWVSASPSYESVMNRLVNRRKNLTLLIETSAYDK